MSKYTICFDTLCQGPQPVLFDDEPAQFDSEQEALAEIDTDPDFYADCFVCKIDEVGRKAIFTGGKP